jgi:hypothetical protein
VKKAYIAGALNADNAVDYLNNRHRMLDYANKIRKLGYYIYPPALLDELASMFGDWSYEDLFDNSVAFLEVCDVMFLTPGWENSKGTKLEIEIAQELNIPIYENLEEL